MALIDNIVSITITRSTAVATVASFNGFLFADEFLIASITPIFSERVRKYTSLNEILSQGFTTSSNVYLAAKAFFSQNPNPGEFYVGRKLTGGDGTETWDVALAAMMNEGTPAANAWYCFSCGTKILAELQTIATWAETVTKLFVISDDDANIIDSTGDIAEYMNTNNLDRSSCLYHPLADESTSDPYAACAWAGKMLAKDPGAATWVNKSLNSVSSYSLTSAQISTAQGKKCNLYQEIGGNDITEGGWVGTGEYLDIIRGIDWLEAKIQELVFTVLLNNDKVPMTDPGIQSVVGALKGALQEAADVGLIIGADDETNGYVVTYPRASEISATDKANRNLTGITFRATLQGAVHKTTITGNVAL